MSAGIDRPGVALTRRRSVSAALEHDSGRGVMEQQIETATMSPVRYARARRVLVDDPGAVFADAHPIARRHGRGCHADLTVPLGAGASLHQDVAVEVGDARCTGRTLVVPMRWKATGRARLLPAFAGELEVSEASAVTALRLRGTYTVPLGALGRIADRVVGRRIAHRSIRALIEQLARSLDAEIELRSAAMELGPEPDLDSLSEQPRSEIYIG